MDSARIAALIRAELGRQNLTHRDLARALGWTDQKIYRRLNGHASWKLHELARVADQLGISASLLTGQPPARRNDSSNDVAAAG